MRSRIWLGVRVGSFAAIIAMASGSIVVAQEPVQAGDAAKALKELTGEIRSLRMAIERTAENQLQSQVLGLYLNLQQNRVAQATARLDGFRKELDGLTNRDRELVQVAAAIDLESTQESDPAKRREIEVRRSAVKAEAEHLAVQLPQARSREAEAYQTAQTEEARWTELISRLEQLLKK